MNSKYEIRITKLEVRAFLKHQIPNAKFQRGVVVVGGQLSEEVFSIQQEEKNVPEGQNIGSEKIIVSGRWSVASGQNYQRKFFSIQQDEKNVPEGQNIGSEKIKVRSNVPLGTTYR